MKIAAFLLHYRYWPQVRPALDALLGQTRPPDRLLVVENGSGDDSAARIRDAYPEVEVVEVARNRGPIAGLNIGTHAALATGADAVLTATHELLLAPDALARLEARLEEDPGVGAVGPLVGYLSDRCRVFSAGGTVESGTWWIEHRDLGGSMETWRGRPPHQVEWLDGCCMLLRSSAARAVVPFFEGFYYFFEEADLLLRMQAQGWRVECVPAAAAWQEPGAASPYIRARNILGLVARNGSRRQLARMVTKVAAGIVADGTSVGDPSRRWAASVKTRGVLDFARGRWGPPPAEVEARWRQELASRRDLPGSVPAGAGPQGADRELHGVDDEVAG